MNNVRNMRETKKMSRYHLAQKTGLSYSTLFIIEKGGDLRVSTLYKIAKALDVHVSELLVEIKDGKSSEK